MLLRVGPRKAIRKSCDCSSRRRDFALSTIRRSSRPLPFAGPPVLRLQGIFKNYAETGALNAQLNLFGFVDDHIFLTKTGDLGVILEVRGVDYECLDSATLD